MIRNKRVYCNSSVLERKHALEPEVKVFINILKKSIDRLKFIELLKNKGNLKYNRGILHKKKDPL